MILKRLRLTLAHHTDASRAVRGISPKHGRFTRRVEVRGDIHEPCDLS